MKRLKAFWLTRKQYPNGSHLNRIEVVVGMLVGVLGIAACLGLLWALNGPVSYVAGWIKNLTA